MFGAVADGLRLINGNSMVTKSHGTILSGGAQPTANAMTIKSTHAFSARCGDCRRDADDGPQAVVLELTSQGGNSVLGAAAPPSMLVGFGPATYPSDFVSESENGALPQEKEMQRQWDQRVLTTPMIWEEPGFVFVECSNEAPKLWSEDLGAYGKPLATPSAASSASCFQFLPDRQLWTADVKLDYARHRSTHDASVSCRNLEGQWEAVWCGSVPTDVAARGVAPYVTLLQPVESTAKIVTWSTQ